MQTISNSTFDFLNDLKENNNRDWFQANKKRYEAAKNEFDLFIAALILEISQFDKSIAHLSAKDCVFRIYRDVRFSKDKSPYKTHFGAYLSTAPKKSEIHLRAGYYLHIEPGASMLGGGAYMPQGEWLHSIRHEIAYNADELRGILNSAEYKKYYNGLEGEKLKKAPRDYPVDHPEIELLKLKSFTSTVMLSNAEVKSDKFIKHASDAFRALYPLNEFMNRA